jgi:asparagine synthase (glutamine-hydrolysing)
MSVQFGRWDFDSKTPDPGYLAKVRTTLAPYDLDGQHMYLKEGMAILYFPFHTSKDSRRRTQPLLSASGLVFSFDGRLDNRAALLSDLGEPSKRDAADVEIVAAAYERWGKASFARVIGDWALAIWNPRAQTLLLSKDFVGSRPLYYSRDNTRITWSTVIDPIVLLAARVFELSEEYIAGWLSSFPSAHLTPYVGIHSVPPSSFVSLSPAKTTLERYWDFDPRRKIRYRSDAEYEEHFRAVFSESVSRRLRSDSPVLAELSGGMDSSSIVCVADDLMAAGKAEAPKLDTISYYDDTEPHWNEQPYFEKVEARRGRQGCHIDVGCDMHRSLPYDSRCFASTPGSQVPFSESRKQFAACLEAQKTRVLLSGFGGDEILGGVPLPLPELADLLVEARFGTLFAQAVDWALAQKKPVLHIATDLFRLFLASRFDGVDRKKRSPRWLTTGFSRLFRDVLFGYRQRLKLVGPPPSFQFRQETLDVLRRQLACFPSSAVPRYETRYPYLDRSLLEFLCAIPREQLVRPQQRRSLMRRALAGVVPSEILDRKRKAFVARRPVLALLEAISEFHYDHQDFLLSRMGILEPSAFGQALEGVRVRQEASSALLRAVGLELWLRTLTEGPAALLVKLPTREPREKPSMLRAYPKTTTFSAEKIPQERR